MSALLQGSGAISPQLLRLLMLGASVLILYGAGRLIFGAIPARLDRPMPRALLAAAGVAIVALVAIAMGRPAVGLHLPIACAAAAMTFGVGALIVARPPAADGYAPNRSWALVAPAVAILLIGGFGGRLDAMLLAALVAYGVVALLAWTDDVDADAEPRAARGPTALTVVIWLGGLALFGLAGVLGMLGLPGLERARQLPSDPLAVVFLIAPAIVVPMIFELLPPGRGDRRPIAWPAAMSSLAKFSLVCLCFVLPLAALAQADADVIRGWARRASGASTTLPTTLTTTNPAPPATEVPTLAFPVVPAVPLRADLLVLAGAMLLTVPLAAGWQRPGTLEALALIACYLLQLALVMGSVVT